MYDAATMKLMNKNGLWEFSDETFNLFPQNSGDTSSILTDEGKVLNAICGKFVVFEARNLWLKKKILNSELHDLGLLSLYVTN